MYIRDVNNLGVASAFEGKSPAALEEITAVMLETARKGMWKASPEQLSTLAQRHSELVAKYGPSGGGMSADNKKLRAFISQQLFSRGRQAVSVSDEADGRRFFGRCTQPEWYGDEEGDGR